MLATKKKYFLWFNRFNVIWLRWLSISNKIKNKQMKQWNPETNIYFNPFIYKIFFLWLYYRVNHFTAFHALFWCSFNINQNIISHTTFHSSLSPDKNTSNGSAPTAVQSGLLLWGCVHFLIYPKEQKSHKLPGQIEKKTKVPLKE